MIHPSIAEEVERKEVLQSTLKKYGFDPNDLCLLDVMTEIWEQAQTSAHAINDEEEEG